MIVPGLYGYVSATKWVVDLEVTRFDRFSAYWTDRGWSEQGPVKTESRVDVPARRRERAAPGAVRSSAVTPGPSTPASRRWSSASTADAWQQADLGRVPGNDTWVQWAGTVDVAAGQPLAGGPGHRPLGLHPDRGARRRRPRRRHRLGQGRLHRRLGEPSRRQSWLASR